MSSQGRRGHRSSLIAIAITTWVVGCAAPAGVPASVPATATPPPSAATTESDPPAQPSDPLAACDSVEPAGDPVEIEVGTTSFAFDPLTISGPLHCQPFVIVFTNTDRPAEALPGGTHRHDISIRLDGVLGPLVFQGAPVGTGTIEYEVPGLPAGNHFFYCSFHERLMSGELVVADA